MKSISLKKIFVPVVGFSITLLLTGVSYWTLQKSIYEVESNVCNSLLQRVSFEFEWRYKQSYVSNFMEYIDSQVDRRQFETISNPSLDYTLYSSSTAWLQLVKPEDRLNFTRLLNDEYHDLNKTLSITTNVEFGVIDERPVDDSVMFPMLYSNPLSLTYLGFDFYTVSNKVLDNAISTGSPTSTDKIILSEFGGVPNTVDNTLVPILRDQYPASFMVYHAVYGGVNGTDPIGVVARVFETRDFIFDVVSSYVDIIEDMGFHVFRKRNYNVLEHDEYELMFDLKTSEESNLETATTLNSIKQHGTNFYMASLEVDELDLGMIVVLTSWTKPDARIYSLVCAIGLVSTLWIWYTQKNLLNIASVNIALSRAKTLFISEMSHELRTPLNGIMGMTDLLIDEVGSPSGVECVQDLKTSGTILLGIISEILDFSRIETGNIQMINRTVCFRTFMMSIMRVLKFYKCSYGRRKPLTLKLDIHRDVPLMLTTDIDKVGKMIMNFVGNSIKFTESGFVFVNIEPCDSVPTRVLKLSKRRRSADFLDIGINEKEIVLKIVVRDTGQGMSSDSMSNLFKPFSQVQLGRSSEGGTGLGLVICKSFSEAMCGGIQCESNLGSGTTFTSWVKAKYSTSVHPPESFRGSFSRELVILPQSLGQSVTGVSMRLSDTSCASDATIPYDGENNGDVETGSISRDPNHPMVLLVDDVSINLKVLGKLLEKMGIKYDTCSSGEDAIEACISNRYELILMDFLMGGCTGLEASKQIRLGLLNKETRIFIVTASEYDEEIDNNGFGYLQKPVTRDSLQKLVDMMVL